MPRFQFQYTSSSPQRDTRDIVLADQNVARREAVSVIRSLLNKTPELLITGSNFRVEVIDEFGALVLTVTLAGEATIVH